MAACRSLAGDTVLVTGAGTRIGRDIALRLADSGANIGVHCHTSTEAAEETAKEIRSRGVHANVLVADLATSHGRSAVISSCVEHFGGLNHLVNSASTYVRVPLTEMNDEVARSTFEINTIAPLMLIHNALPHMQAVPGGCVVNLVDVFGDRPWPEFSAYCASKSALLALTRALAVELAPSIRVNGVGPGAILFPDWVDAPERSKIVEKIPQGRLGTPAEIAESVAFLIEGPEHITGHLLAVDGGFSLHS